MSIIVSGLSFCYVSYDKISLIYKSEFFVLLRIFNTFVVENTCPDISSEHNICSN